MIFPFYIEYHSVYFYLNSFLTKGKSKIRPSKKRYKPNTIFAKKYFITS